MTLASRARHKEAAARVMFGVKHLVVKSEADEAPEQLVVVLPLGVDVRRHGVEHVALPAVVREQQVVLGVAECVRAHQVHPLAENGAPDRRLALEPHLHRGKRWNQ